MAKIMKGKGPAFKMIGVCVPVELKSAFEAACADLDSTSSAMGHTLILEFLREYEATKAKGRLAWPIKMHLAYHPAPEIRFGDEEQAEIPRGAEGGVENSVSINQPEKGSSEYPKLVRAVRKKL